MEKTIEMLKRTGIEPTEEVKLFCQYFDRLKEIRQTMESSNEKLPQIERQLEELNEKRRMVFSKINEEATKQLGEELKSGKFKIT